MSVLLFFQPGFVGNFRAMGDFVFGPSASASSAYSHRNGLYRLTPMSPPTTQKAVITSRVTSILNLTVATVPVRQPLPTEVVVRICYSGICRSVSQSVETDHAEMHVKRLLILDFQDATFSKGPLPGFPSTNHIAGHEGIGQIVEASDAGLLGRFVGLRYLGSTCRHCEYCLARMPTSCPLQKNAPKQLSGSFQEYVTVDTESLLFIPQDIIGKVHQPEILCGALCSGAAALMALRAAKLTANMVVVVVGVAGSIGNYTATMAKGIFGARVIGVDVAWKVEELRRRGCDNYADILLAGPSDEEDTDAVSSLKTAILHGCAELRPQHAMARAADAVIVTASSATAFRRLESYVCDGGWIVCSG